MMAFGAMTVVHLLTSHIFVFYIYEDKKGNIWTNSKEGHKDTWALSRYEENSLSNKQPTVTVSHQEGLVRFWKLMMEVFGLALMSYIVMMEIP
jgi:hypothetical protein